MANFPHYIKFFRGTTSAWESVQHPDEDTLYFIYPDNDATKGKLYLGNKIIGNIGESVSLEELANLNIDENLLIDGQILTYDSSIGKWKNTFITDIFDISIGPMKGATDQQNGEIGLVPTPYIGDQDKFLKGDGTWATPINTQQGIQDNLTSDSVSDSLSARQGKVLNTAIINHATNINNPHNITKAQLGLSNVTNYDQSKAIKSIVRNGMTFTYTCLDGTTGTFTQQDNNTKVDIIRLI